METRDAGARQAEAARKLPRPTATPVPRPARPRPPPKNDFAHPSLLANAVAIDFQWTREEARLPTSATTASAR